jgi:hypothetical protein
MLSRLTRSFRPSSRRDRFVPASAQDRRRRSAADSALVSRHGQDLLVGLRHQV